MHILTPTHVHPAYTHARTHTLTGVFSGSVLMEDLFLNSELSLLWADAKSGMGRIRLSTTHLYLGTGARVRVCVHVCVVWFAVCDHISLWTIPQ